MDMLPHIFLKGLPTNGQQNFDSNNERTHSHWRGRYTKKVLLSEFGRRVVGFTIFAISNILILPMSLFLMASGGALFQVSPLLAVLLSPFWAAFVLFGGFLFIAYAVLLLISIALVFTPSLCSVSLS
ncbi:hypothetical protein GOP47_0018257 [Adiantum capillus-veneris]|uniref:Uncharacterized protein n=1 Tax=Adiantum capillus-veneris TaxID=13818 RepID=A0A9D4UGZ4_ADICA|nr:hypothetical protein GOP47_0018257 [Adiantum capillus-veneris]